MKYYVYIHIRCDNNKPFYVGMSSVRVKGFIYSRAYRTPFTRKDNWGLFARNIQYKVDIIKTDLSKDDAIFLEKELIQKYGRIDLGTGCLINQCDGGLGLSNPGPLLKIKIKNNRKHCTNVLKKAQSPYSTITYKYSSDGQYIEEYSSIRKAALANKCLASDISQALKGNRYLIAGFQWRTFKVEDGIGKAPEKRKPTKSLLQINYNTDIIIREWKSSSEAAKQLGISRTGINNCLKGRSKTSSGYKWQYKT